MSEKHVHQAVVNYLKLQYPKVLFRSDSGAGMKLTIGQAKAQKAIQNGMAWPDLFIAEARGESHGLFIEIKDENVRLLNKKNQWTSEHIYAQSYCLNMLRLSGFKAEFAIGFDQCKEAIDEYLNS